MTALVPSEMACLESSPLVGLAEVQAENRRGEQRRKQDSRKDEPDRGLDLTRRDGRAVVVRRELGSLGSDPLENVRDERVEDGHGLVAGKSAKAKMR